jgi:hypothetical protein
MLDWQDLALLPDPELAKRDLVEINLAWTADFPEARQYKPQAVFDRIDFLAREVKRYTDKVLPQFQRKRYDYNNSEGYFRCLAMVTCVERDHGVCYHPDKQEDHVPHTAVDSSLYGPILGQGGTCASLPVVFAAIGRRLGYPIKLANGRGHVYWRWDAPGGECFNVDSAGNGMASHPDDYYRTGQYAVTKEEEEAYGLVRSLTPRAELAMFLQTRGFRWVELGEQQLGCHAFLWAVACQPQSKGTVQRAAFHLNRWHEQLKARIPPRFPVLNRVTPPRRLFPAGLPHPLEPDFHYLTVLETLLNDPRAESRWWNPLRRGEQLRERVPVEVDISTAGAGFHMTFKFDEYETRTYQVTQ